MSTGQAHQYIEGMAPWAGDTDVGGVILLRGLEMMERIEEGRVMAEAGTKRTRILIVEDEGLFRGLLEQVLAAEPLLDVVGSAADGETAIRLAEALRPDVVLMDIELAGPIDGIKAAEHIKRERPETGIVILSAHKEKQYIASLPLGRTPGWSYLLKQSVGDINTLVRAIHGSASGLMVLDPGVVAGLRPREGTRVARLTPRQQEVLKLMAQGYNNATIAERLHLGEKSVENYINAVYQELQLTAEERIHPRVKASLIYLEESQSKS
ncbi:MAG: response regulator transcription factor [Chloroflexi bacterium]|nr:response regulator transcription factor [Chloroflexota bacterium]